MLEEKHNKRALPQQAEADILVFLMLVLQWSKLAVQDIFTDDCPLHHLRLSWFFLTLEDYEIRQDNEIDELGRVSPAHKQIGDHYITQCQPGCVK